MIIFLLILAWLILLIWSVENPERKKHVRADIQLHNDGRQLFQSEKETEKEVFKLGGSEMDQGSIRSETPIRAGEQEAKNIAGFVDECHQMELERIIHAQGLMQAEPIDPLVQVIKELKTELRRIYNVILGIAVLVPLVLTIVAMYKSL